MNILITGANKGIGKEIARQMAIKGNQVILTSRNKERGEAALAELQTLTKSDKIHYLQLDVTNPKDAKKAADYVAAHLGHLDILINNAGIIVNRDDSTIAKIADIKSTFETNFYGPLIVSQALIPLMKASQDARIINVSSSMGALHRMKGEHVAYRVSKTALNALSVNMSQDLMADGIKVFSVDPGWVHTDMGGKEAPRTHEEGANSITCMIDIKNALSGGFYRDGERLDW